jgi:alpha/beta superfamily hydrolase
MHNKVVHTLARSVRDLGGVAVRFNYRGVEGSEGDYDDGVGEVADYVAVYQWALARFAVQRTCLAGFSFGSYISATALSQVSGRQVSGQQVSGLEVVPAGLLLVAPPVARMPFETLPAFEVPSFVIQGEQDDVVAPESVYEWVREREDVAEDHLVRIAKADHFFHGCLSLLKKEATSVFQVCLGLAEESS